jgi:fido (protein-threonine AMPylation protein)
MVLPQDARFRKLWAIHPFPKGMGRATGLAPPRKQSA